MQSGAPALVRLLDAATERLGHHLVTEADPDHLAVLGSADEVHQRRNPRIIVIDTRGRAGDQYGVVCVRVGEVARGVARLKDRKLHGARLATSFRFRQWQSERGAPWQRTTGLRAAMP